MVIEPAERERHPPEELVHPEEVPVEHRQDDLGRVALVRDPQLALLHPVNILLGLLHHRRLELLLPQPDRHERVVCTFEPLLYPETYIESVFTILPFDFQSFGPLNQNLNMSRTPHLELLNDSDTSLTHSECVIFSKHYRVRQELQNTPRLPCSREGENEIN